MNSKTSLFLLSGMIGAIPVAAQNNQNWIATDIEGNTHSIQDYLDQGKTILVEFSAHWCGPCWTWHQTGIQEKLYHEFGPEGTNDLMIFFVDADSASSIALLQGAAGSHGDYIDGTPYPIIGPSGEGVALAQFYGNMGFPTHFMHCPDAPAGVFIAREDTWELLFESWRNGCMEAFTNGANDATLLSQEPLMLCHGEYPRATIYNMGTNALTNVFVDLKLDGIVLQTKAWTGDLARWNSAEVIFDEVGSSGSELFTAEVRMPNGVEDEHPEGDTENYVFQWAPEAMLTTIHLELRTDYWGSETTWKLFDSANNVVAQDPPGSYENNQTYTYWWTLNPNECYRFEMYDVIGDGICCDNGNGYYKLYSGGELLGQGGEFSTLDIFHFVTGVTVGVEENILTNVFSIHPNPTHGELSIRFELAASSNVHFTLHNVLGEIVQHSSKVFGSGAHELILDLGDLPIGTYMLNLQDQNSVVTRKVIVDR